MPSAITASSVMLRSASLLNDSAQSSFTDTVLLPYLQTAYDELAEKLEENNIPITNKVSSTLVVTTAMTAIGDGVGPALPTDLIEIQSCNERLSGSNEDFREMIRVEFLPSFTQKTESLVYWTWQNQIIYFLGATTNRDVKLNYIALTLGAITSGSSMIALFNAKNFLAYRTAALASEFIGENKTRADSLNIDARISLERVLNISVKGKQSLATRRKPFMAGYKIFGGW